VYPGAGKGKTFVWSQLLGWQFRVVASIVEVVGYITRYSGALALGFDWDGSGTLSGVSR